MDLAWRRGLGALLVTLICWLGCGQALAQGASTPPPSAEAKAEAPAPAQVEEKQRIEAKERFLRGLDLASQENWDAALVEFMASRELFPTRAALSNIPLSLRHLKRYAEAIDAYNELIQKFGSTLSPDERKKVDEALGELRSLVGEIDVESDQKGSVVVIDGQQRGLTPLPAPILVNAGTHSVRVASEGFQSFEAQVPVAGKQRKLVQAKLQRLAKSGTLVVKEAQGQSLDVVIDGAVVGKSPWQGVLAVGLHGVTLRGEGDIGSLPGAATVRENETATVTLTATKLDAKVRVEPVPASARVDIDGVSVGAGIWEGQLTSGSHTIEVYAPGHVSYRKPITVSSGRREIVRVALERDLTDPMWKDAFRPHVFVELTGGIAYAPSFGTTAEASCDKQVAIPTTGTVPGCSDRSSPFGFLVGGRGGFQITPGFAAEAFVGYLSMSNSLTRNLVTEGEKRTPTLLYHSTNVLDTTSVSAPMGALSVSYRFFEKTPLIFRLWGGAMRARVKHNVSGTFFGTVPDPDGDGEVNQKVTVFEPARSVWVPMVGPEVRVGLKISRRFSVDLGVAGFFFFGPSEARQGNEAEDPLMRRPSVLADVTGANGNNVRTGFIYMPQEKSVALFFSLVPTLGVRLDI